MIYLFPQIWHDYDGNNYRRRKNDIQSPIIRRVMPHEWVWQRIRRVFPGVWVSVGQEFNLDDVGFFKGKYKADIRILGERIKGQGGQRIMSSKSTSNRSQGGRSGRVTRSTNQQKEKGQKK